MEMDKLSPEKSLELITQTIAQARNTFEENGIIYTFWGGLIAIASISQFLLLKSEYYEISWYPYLLMPMGGIFTGYYFSRKTIQSNQNQISKIIIYAWIALGLNMMILGFLFALDLKENLIPLILVLLSVGIMLSGASIRNTLIFCSGILINLSAFLCFNIEWIYHSLLMGIVSIVAVFIPGVWLMIQRRRKGHV